MKLSSSNFFMLSFACIALLVANAASGQQHVKVQKENGEAIEDAVIIYNPLQLKSYQKIAVTDAYGKAKIVSETPFSLVISRIGYITIADTLQPGQSKTYTLIPSNVKLEDVVVTGQFEPVIADKSVQRIKVIDRKRIEQQGAVNLRDLLTNEANIRLSQDGVLGTQMSMMGVGGQNVKILVDGVPVIGRNDGNIDISQLNLNNIERVEIVEGPMSVIYGTDALGGAINLITKKPSSKQYNATLNTYYETVGTYNIDMNGGMRYKNFQLAASGGRNFFDGYSPNEDEKLRFMQWKPREQYFGDIQLRYRFKNQSHRLYSQYFNEKIIARYTPIVTPYSATGFDDHFVTIRFNNSLYSDFYFNNKATLNLINSYATYERRKISYAKNLVTGNETLVPDASAQDTTQFYNLLFRATYTTNNSSVFNSQFGYDINIETGTGEKLEGERQQIGDYAAFYIADIKPVSRLTLRQGLRFIYNTRYGAPVIPSINIKYDLTSSLSARASYAMGFRAPSLKELSLFFVDVNHNIQGNSNLNAERSNNFMASLTYSKQIKRWSYKIDAMAFYNEITDLITLALVDANAQLYSYTNVDNYKAQGLTLTGNVQYKNVTLTGGYTLTGRYNQLSDTLSVPEFSYSNEYRLNATYSFRKAGIDISTFYKYNGALPGYALDNNGNTYQTNIQEFSTLDASVTKSFKNNMVKVTIGAKNLTNVQSIAYNSTASAHSAGAGNMPIAMGRYYFASLRINIAKN